MRETDMIRQALHLAGFSTRRLTKKLAYSNENVVRKWRRGLGRLTVGKMAEALAQCNLAFGWTPDRGFWVARPDRITIPKDAYRCDVFEPEEATHP
jgi:hypothetical protein